MIIDSMESEGREPEVIKRKEIPGFFNHENRTAIDHYVKSKTYGLPYTGNKWALEPCIIMDIIWALDNETAIIQNNRRGK
jgi:hypothetical protein